MPSFVNTVDLTVDGERLRIKTNAGDQLNAERGIGKSPMDFPVELGMRVWYCAFKHGYPDHPAAKAFGRFVEALEGGDELEPDGEELDPMDPTRLAD